MKDSSLLEIKNENIVDIVNQIAFRFRSCFFHEKPKIEIIEKNDKFYLTKIDDKEYFDLNDRLKYHLVPKNFEFKPRLEIVKMNLDYYFYRFLANYTSEISKMFQSYLNFLTYYHLYILVYHSLEKEILNANLDSSFFDTPLFSFRWVFYALPRHYLFLDQSKISKNTKKILKFRKKKLKENLNYYYLFSFVDYNRFYLDCYYDITRLFLEIFERKKISAEELRKILLNLEPPENIYVQDPIINCKYYNNAFYFMLPDNDFDSKLSYFITISRYFRLPYFKVSDVIENYPSLSPTILRIQEEIVCEKNDT